MKVVYYKYTTGQEEDTITYESLNNLIS